MTIGKFRLQLQFICAIVSVIVLAAVWNARTPVAHAAPAPAAVNAVVFEQQVKPFLKQNCMRCHNEETSIAGVRVDQLDAALSDRHIKLWEGIRNRVRSGSMPPKGQPQPTSAARQQIVSWISEALEVARLRPTPKNGVVRRLTVAQYRNTLRDLLQLEDDLSDALPPDAISKDGFVNNQETLQLSPLLFEAYLEIAEKALNRAVVDPKSKPAVQTVKMELGTSINPAPFPEKLILGAGNLLLDNKDFIVTQPAISKPFPFEPVKMQTKFRYIEGYQGNDTVRGWREYDSIYHAVFACMRGSNGYPKGSAYGTVPQGLVLRPAIPSDELFGLDGTYGPKANFKISLRELPDHGRFRVTVMAAKYSDGLLLDAGVKPQPAEAAEAIVAREAERGQTVAIKKAGVYQVDVHAATKSKDPVAPDASRLNEGLAAEWKLEGSAGTGKLEGKTKFVDSPFGKAASLNGDGDSIVIPRGEAINVGAGDFTVSAWIHPTQARRAGIIAAAARGVQGWYLEMPDNRGMLRLETAGPDNQSNGVISSQNGVIRANAWQHVVAVVKRGSKNESRLYVNGYAVAKGEIGNANLDNLKSGLYLGRIPDAQQFRGEIDEVRLYKRALNEAEVQALVQPGKQFVVAPPAERTQDLTLALAGREFTGSLKQPAFLTVRLDAGPLKMDVRHTGLTDMDKVVFTPLAADHELAKKFLAFEKRSPKVGVHLGIRRDCGSSLVPAGPAQTVSSTKLSKFVFEGAMHNFPNTDVEKDNVNYLAGVREIGVRSEYTDGRDMPRLMIRSVEFEGPFYDQWPPQTHKNIFIESAQKTNPQAYAREILRSFATRAYRRPITPVEEASLMTVFTKSAASGRAFQDSVKDALQVVLTSPQFLFIIENSKTPEPEPIESYELASKLSYFLWNSPPDRTTLALAAKGSLRGQLDAEVNRMIDSPKFEQFTREFVAQWLSLDKFSVLEPDRKRYPDLKRETRTQLRQEPIQLLQYMIRKNLPVKTLIDSDFIMANETVATYYGLGDKTESGFQFLPIIHGHRELGGVMTTAAIMAGLSDGRESNPVKRGAWLARRIISEPPADPPPNVPALKEDPEAKLTLRQRIEQHRNQPGCQQCHTKIDPWGVAFEEFDAGGRLKKEAADARSKLPDNTEVAGINDFKKYLSVDRIDQVAFSVMKHMATYANGRTLTFYEQNQLKQEGLKLRANGYRMRDMVHYVATSKLFLEK